MQHQITRRKIHRPREDESTGIRAGTGTSPEQRPKGGATHLEGMIVFILHPVKRLVEQVGFFFTWSRVVFDDTNPYPPVDEKNPTSS